VRSGLLDVERSHGLVDIGMFACEPPTWCGTRWSAGSIEGVRAIVSRPRRVIYLSNRNAQAGLDTRSLTETLARLLVEIGEDDTSVSLVFVRDRPMREINRLHRGEDAPTDVLSFRSIRRGVRSPRPDATAGSRARFGAYAR